MERSSGVVGGRSSGSAQGAVDGGGELHVTMTRVQLQGEERWDSGLRAVVLERSGANMAPVQLVF